MIEPPVSVPIEATVVLEFPTIRLVIVAKVEKREEMNPLVVVLLVAVRLLIKAFVVLEFPTIRLVIVAKVEKREEMVPVVEKRLVLVLLVITEEEAKMLFAKRLRNLLRGVPRL